MRLVMKDYHKSSASLNLQCNAKHWADYIIQHSRYDYVPDDVQKSLRLMISGLNWERNVYQPSRNILYTNLVKQQYLTVRQLHLFTVRFEYFIKNILRPKLLINSSHDEYDANEYKNPAVIERDLRLAHEHLLNVFQHLSNDYDVLNEHNAINNLDSVQDILRDFILRN